MLRRTPAGGRRGEREDCFVLSQVNSETDAARVLPVGVFDSGVGGLTVLEALRGRLPAESFIYLGDTARLPYGTKSRDSIIQYSIQAADLLVQRGVKCLVVACNTASSVALETLRERYAPLPVLGVVEPGAEAGCRISMGGRIAVIATESTVREGAYQRAILRRRPDAVVTALACPLFVALAEEGWTDGPIALAVAHRYLDDLLAQQQPDTLVLGCTHFPVLAKVLQAVAGPEVALVDSAATTASALELLLRTRRMLNPGATPGQMVLLATDGPERFARVGGLFLHQQLAAADVHLVDLGVRPQGFNAATA
jgi:glutamate racemase